jgi:hypothetical protein
LIKDDVKSIGVDANDCSSHCDVHFTAVLNVDDSIAAGECLALKTAFGMGGVE